MTVPSNSYYPDRGDIIWIYFNPHSGYEQAGHRPALVLSPVAYNRKTKLLFLCPITSSRKNYPFEVVLPKACGVEGVFLSDHVKSPDRKARTARFNCKAPESIVIDTLNKLGILLDV